MTLEGFGLRAADRRISRTVGLPRSGRMELDSFFLDGRQHLFLLQLLGAEEPVVAVHRLFPHSIFSLMARSHAMWLSSPSTERPTRFQFTFANCPSREAKVMNSDVHTGVKSAGRLNRIPQLPE